MLFYFSTSLGSRFETVARTFAQQPESQFLQALPESRIQTLAAEEGVHFGNDPDDVYTPAVTLWAFLTQVMSGCKSCTAAVARVLVLMAILGRPIPSANTGAYCKARAKLPERCLKRLALTVAVDVEDRAAELWRWQGRRVLLADGFEVSLADTRANQQTYPQPASQAPGVGFPMMRVVVLFTFATAGIVRAAYGPHQGKETGEPALFRQLLGALRPGAVVVADRYYCSYWLVAMLQELDVAVAFRLHQRRHYDFRRGRQLGKGDHVVAWVKPARPDWMEPAVYAQLPATLSGRELRVQVAQPGSRSKQIIVATTLLDAEAYPAQDIGDLYHRRWHVELDIRAIKQTLQMEYLVCKTPAMVRRELWAHLLAYNLVRQVLAAAALESGHQPRQLSLAGALQTLEAFRWIFLGEEVGNADGRSLTTILLVAIGTHEVGDRPNRVEPRKVKRRPKSYGRLNQPRAQAREQLLRN